MIYSFNDFELDLDKLELRQRGKPWGTVALHNIVSGTVHGYGFRFVADVSAPVGALALKVEDRFDGPTKTPIPDAAGPNLSDKTKP